MAEQQGGLTVLLHQLERQMRHEWKTAVVGADQARERVPAHEGCGVLRLIEVFGQVHGNDGTVRWSLTTSVKAEIQAKWQFVFLPLGSLACSDGFYLGTPSCHWSTSNSFECYRRHPQNGSIAQLEIVVEYA